MSMRLVQPSLFRHDPIARLWLLRLVASGVVGLGHLHNDHVTLDDEVLAVLGYRTRPADTAEVAAQVQCRLDARLARAELAASAPPTIFHRNLARLAEALGLTDDEAAVAGAVGVLADEAFNHSAANIEDDRDAYVRAIATIIKRPLRTVRRTLAADAPLRQMGLVRLGGRRGRPVNLKETIATLLWEPFRTTAGLVEAIVPRAPKPTIRLADFPQLEGAIALVVQQLKAAIAPPPRRARGAQRGQPQILLHGPPGTSKTQLSRLLSLAAGGQAHVVLDPEEDDDIVHHRRDVDRISQLRLCEVVLRGVAGSVLVVDEAEDIFRMEGVAFLGQRGAMSDKATVLRQMEEATAPVIWISNDVESMDEAALRRFDSIIAAPRPMGPHRKAVAHKLLRHVALAPETVQRLANDDHLPPAMIEKAAAAAALATKASRAGRRTARAAGPTVAPLTPDRAAILVVDAFHTACGRRPAPAPSTTTGWSKSFVNSTPPVEDVITTIQRAPSARASVLLHGPPGTGKTELVKELQRRTGLPLVQRRGSDLLSKWLGDTEKRLAAMFAEAADVDGILFLDEAETFLGDRRNARQSWEVSQVNELLVLMAEFRGIFVCATNLTDRIDPAAFRRFDLKVAFTAPTAEQRRQLLQGRFGPLLSDDDLERALPRLTGLCVGDVVAVEGALRFHRHPTAGIIIELLEAEVRLRNGGRDHRRIGFASQLPDRKYGNDNAAKGVVACNTQST